MSMVEKEKERISMSLPGELLNLIDEKRGDVPRSAYLRKIIVRALQGGGKKV